MPPCSIPEGMGRVTCDWYLQVGQCRCTGSFLLVWAQHNVQIFPQAFVSLVPRGQLSTPKTHTGAAESVWKCKNFTQEQGLKLFSF